MAKFGRFVTGLVLVGATVGAGLGAVVLDAAPAGAASAPSTSTRTVDSSTVTAANCTPGSEVADSCNLRDALAEAAAVGDTAINLPDANTIRRRAATSIRFSPCGRGSSMSSTAATP